jgi:hypothetical protein
MENNKSDLADKNLGVAQYIISERPLYRHPVAWICLTIIVVSLLLYVGFCAWSENSRFYLANGKDGIVHKIDRKSGETWTFKNGSEIKHHKEQEIPSYEAGEITGRGGYDRAISYSSSYNTDTNKEPELKSTFSGTLYNGTNWHITKIEFSLDNSKKIGTTKKDGKKFERWSRNFRAKVFIDPKGNGSFSFDTGEGHWNEATEWGIQTVWGYREDD